MKSKNIMRVKENILFKNTVLNRPWVQLPLFFIFVLFVALLWSAQLFVEWGTDYGVYYATSYFLDDDYRLYKEAFSHKGPFYFFFIKEIGDLIGWGALQSYAVLAVTVMFFYLSVLYVLLSKINNTLIAVVVSLVVVVSLYSQSTNISISLFQSTFVILSFYMLLESLNESSIGKYLLSVMLIAFAFFVRIDAVIYFPVYIVAIIFMFMNGVSIKKLLLLAILIVFGLSIVYCFFAYYFGFTSQNFIAHNVDFNRFYKSQSILGYIYRPTQFPIIISAGAFALFVIIAGKMSAKIKSFITRNGKSLNVSGNIESQQYVLSSFIVFLGFLLWVISNSDKNYHVFFMVTPLLFFVAYWGNCLQVIRKKVAIIAIPLLVYVLFLTVHDGVKVLLKYKHCTFEYDCNESDVSTYMATIDKMNKKYSSSVVGGRGWTYFFSNSRPERAINDWWMYYKKEPFVTEYLLKAHNELINRPSGYEFWIDKAMLASNERSLYFKQILAVSEEVEDEGRYIRYRIK